MSGLVFDALKRDAVRIFCDRFREWLALQIFSVDEQDDSLEYRRGWNAAIRHVEDRLAR